MFLQRPAFGLCSGWLFVVKTCGVSDYSRPLKHGDTLQDTMHTTFSGARLWADIVPLCPFFGSFVFLFTTFFQHCLSSYITQIRREPTPHSLARLHFPSRPRHLVGSVHKERSANHSRPPRKLDQSTARSYLHTDAMSQSGVSAGENSQRSSQWLQEV